MQGVTKLPFFCLDTCTCSLADKCTTFTLIRSSIIGIYFCFEFFLDEKIHCCVSQTRVIVLQEGNLVIRYNYGGNLKRLEPPVIKT